MTNLITAEGHIAETTNSASLALQRVLAEQCDMLLIDADLPSLEGLQWLAALRQTDRGRSTPVIVASAKRTDNELSHAFALGADDCVLKSCPLPELAARLRSVLRRRFEREPLPGQPIRIGPILLDPACHECRVRQARVRLNPREFELLEALMRRAGRVLTRPYLLEAVWKMDRFANTRTVDVAVSRLRKALGRRAASFIETVERYGYRLKANEVSFR